MKKMIVTKRITPMQTIEVQSKDGHVGGFIRKRTPAPNRVAVMPVNDHRASIETQMQPNFARDSLYASQEPYSLTEQSVEENTSRGGFLKMSHRESQRKKKLLSPVSEQTQEVQEY